MEYPSYYPLVDTFRSGYIDNRFYGLIYLSDKCGNILKFKGIKHNNDLCYWVKCQLISDNKNDARKYINDRTFNCSSCSQCYKFCFRNYFKKDGEYKYIPRLTKRNLASLMSQSK